MKLSVVIPCFNEEKTLKLIVERVLNYKEIEKEILIVDDCSTDNSKSIINELSNKYSEVREFILKKI